MTASLSAKPNGTQVALQVNGVDALLLDNAGIVSGIKPSSVTPAMLTQPMTLATAVSTTSGTAIDFTGIPSWVKRITITFDNVSTSGSSPVIVQLGSGSVQTTGYLGSGSNAGNGAGWTIAAFTTGLATSVDSNAGRARYGMMTIATQGGNKWSSNCMLSVASGSEISTGASGVTLSGTLDRMRITTVGGTDTFDAGSVNILYEG